MDFCQEESNPLFQQFIEECLKGNGRFYVKGFNLGRGKKLLPKMLYWVCREMENRNPETQEYENLFKIKKLIEIIISH